MDTNVSISGLAPFSLKDAPALIERVFPAQKIGIESQKERKAGSGQTLTALGSYWKGRKPLVLVRATVLASLLPATNDPEADLRVFDLIMCMDDVGMLRRQPKVTATHVMDCPDIDPLDKLPHLSRATPRLGGDHGASPKSPLIAKWRPIDLSHIHEKRASDEERTRVEKERNDLRQRAFVAMPFSQKVSISNRVETVEDLEDGDDALYGGIWDRVNDHLGTTARSLPDLVEQLGIARFGQRPVVGDPFCGGGSIPFEAARVGCDVVASDLNPVAAMLTWGALNIIGANAETREKIAVEQKRFAAIVDAEITRLGIEHDSDGNRAKAFLYCLEVVDPQTGWRVPMTTTMAVSISRRVVMRLVPDYSQKRFDIHIDTGVSESQMVSAVPGTVQDGHLVYRLAPVAGGEEREYRIPIARLRRDGEGPLQADGNFGNRLRLWEPHDVVPYEPVWVSDVEPVLAGASPGAWVGGDIWLERLYCIQWISGSDLRAGKARPDTWFAAPTAEDLCRETAVLTYVQDRIVEWQLAGLIPDMQIEPGEKTDEPIRTRGWTRWHHLFGKRELCMFALAAEHRRGEHASAITITLAKMLDWNSRLCQWRFAEGADANANVFANQALNTNITYCSNSWLRTCNHLYDGAGTRLPDNSRSVQSLACGLGNDVANLWIYDPPYADAVHYHEITEFFIAWLRKTPPSPFDQWTWDSRRPLAIQGKGEKFRIDMVNAFKAMADHMPNNGMQVCMFTHKDAGVWADMAGIVWAAGLRVTAAWYVSTETTSELKKGGYVQGTVLLILRKRAGEEHGYRSDIVPEVRARVALQVETLAGLNQRTKGNGREENLFSDADIQMAGYAAALEVLTDYTHIDGVDMTREALRPRETRRRGQSAEIGIVEEMIALAVQTANERMVPEGLPESMWERLGPTERFYLKMTAAEAAWHVGATGGKLDDYQTFAKAYRAEGWEDLLADRTPNRARIKSATELHGALLQGHPVSIGSLRPTLYAVMCLTRDAAIETDPETSGNQALFGLRDVFGDSEWLRARDNVRSLAEWFGRTWERRNPEEAGAARVLASLIASERL